jgi:hypothetical protein
VEVCLRHPNGELNYLGGGYLMVLALQRAESSPADFAVDIHE